MPEMTLPLTAGQTRPSFLRGNLEHFRKRKEKISHRQEPKWTVTPADFLTDLYGAGECNTIRDRFNVICASRLTSRTHSVEMFLSPRNLTVFVNKKLTLPSRVKENFTGRKAKSS